MAEDDGDSRHSADTPAPSPLLSLQLPPVGPPAPRAARPRCGHMGQGLSNCRVKPGVLLLRPVLGCWTAQEHLPSHLHLSRRARGQVRRRSQRGQGADKPLHLARQEVLPLSRPLSAPPGLPAPACHVHTALITVPLVTSRPSR